MTLAPAGLSAAAWGALERTVGPECLSRSVPASLLDDPTGLYVGMAAAVVRPQDTAQVQAVLKGARAHALRLVPRGGGTSLAAGAVPQSDEIVLDLSALRLPLHVDAVERTVTAGAGCTLAEVQQALAPLGLRLPIDIGSWQSATVGGVVSTNAGGTQVLRHGHVRQLLLGVEAVLGTGEVIRRLDGWRKDNNGPDISALLCGSEGTLGVVTAATFRVVPQLEGARLLGVLVPGWTELLQVVLAARDIASVQAIEMISGPALALVRDVVRAPFAGASGHLLLIDLAGVGSANDAAQLVQLIERWADDVVMAQDASERASLWATRHAVSEAIRRCGRPQKLDLALPLATLGHFLPAVEALALRRSEAFLFGHIADGNVHVNLLGADVALLDEVVALATAHGGHASAEHGIGVAKARWLPLTRTAAELDVLDGLRRLFDPQGVLNPRVFRG